MVMLIQALPFEILLQIFQNLTTKSLVDCATVCKSWYQPAIRVIYEHIELNNSPARKLAFYENQETGVNVGTLARSLKIGLGYYQLQQEQFLKLLSYMPYLKVIELDAPVYQLFKYLDYMSKRDENCIRYLEYLNFDDNLTSSNEMERYFLLAYSFRNTLKNLYLYGLRKTYTIGGSSVKKSAVEFLNDFPKLTRLTVENRYGKNDDNLSIFHITRSCPNLISFDFRSQHPTPEYNETSNVIDESNGNSQQPSSSKTVTVAKPKLKKLQNFALHLCNMTDTQTQHILSSLPTETTMNSFKLELYGTYSGIWVQELQESSLEHLGKYLANVRQQSEFSISSYNRNPDIHLNDIPSSLNITAKFLPLIGTIMKYKKPLYCHFQIHVSNLVRYKLSAPFSIKKNDRYLLFSYTLDSEEYETRLFHSQVPELSLLNALIPVPNTNAKEEPSFDKKMVSSMEIVLEDTSMKHSRFLDILQSAIYNCPLLKYISFTKRSNRCKLKFGCAPETCDTSGSGRYTGFQFESCYGKTPIDTPSTPKESLQYALLSHTKFRQTAFPIIANLLSGIKVMKLIHCEIEKDESSNSTLDIRGIEHLQQLVLDIGFIVKKRRYVFIMVEMENDQVLCFKADGGSHFTPLFRPVAIKYIHTYKRLESVHSSAIIIKCQKIDEIGISLHGDNVQTLIKSHLNSVAYLY